MQILGLELATWESTGLLSVMFIVLGCVVLLVGDQLCTPEDKKVRRVLVAIRYHCRPNDLVPYTKAVHQ
jgi:hypothetical protein